MTRDVVTVAADAELEEAAALLLERGISGMPVLDDAGALVGMITKTDLLDALLAVPRRRWAASLDCGLDPSFAPEGSAPATVREAMTRLAFTLREDAPLGQAAALLSFEGIHRAPVVDGRGRIVGIVSAMDLVRALAACSDGEDR